MTRDYSTKWRCDACDVVAAVKGTDPPKGWHTGVAVSLIPTSHGSDRPLDHPHVSLGDLCGACAAVVYNAIETFARKLERHERLETTAVE